MFSGILNRIKGAFEGQPSEQFAPIFDFHSHLLPGIDDGAKDIEDSLGMLRALSEMGYKQMVLTPHVLREFYPNTSGQIKQTFDYLQEEAAKNQIDIELEVSAEYFMDPYFLELLKAKDLLPFGENKSTILVETSFHAPTGNIEDFFFKIKSKGYSPIFAHPERYFHLHGDLEIFHKIVEHGVELQLNLLSLTGNYGPEVQKTAHYLLKNKLIHYVGTDCHHFGHVEGLKQLFDQKTTWTSLKNNVINFEKQFKQI